MIVISTGLKTAFRRYERLSGHDVLSAGIEWLPSESQDLLDAFGLMKKFADQAVSFTDSLSFVLMKKAGLRDVFGFDGHFSAAGFRLWPGR